MGKHQLTLSPNYVPDWTYVEAVREFFQNALDNQTISPENEMFFNYENNVLTIGNKTSVLTLDTLLLGSTSKRDDSRTIGKHGEGYKAALMVLLREGKTVTFYNYGAREVWTTRFVKSRKYNGALLVEVNVDKKYPWTSVPDNNLTIVIEGVTDSEYNEVVKTNLHLRDYPDNYCIVSSVANMGYILKEPEFKGKVFVNGLYICSNDKFEFGYDILPEFIDLDRDRRLVDSVNLAWVTSRMWRYAGDEELIARLIIKDVWDIKYIKTRADYRIQDEEHKIDNQIRHALHKEFSEIHGEKAIPVSANKDLQRINESKGDYKPVMVSQNVTEYLEDVVESPVPVGLSAKEQLEMWFEGVRDKLTEQEVTDFKVILEDL